MSTESSEEISTTVQEEADPLSLLLLGFLLLLSLGGGIVNACLWNDVYNAHRIIKANQLIVARIVQHKDGRFIPNSIPATMQLSYDYDDENYLVWRNNYDQRLFPATSLSIQKSVSCKIIPPKMLVAIFYII